jgi:ribosomal protein S18 acetylase RimI-like enzyme
MNAIAIVRVGPDNFEDYGPGCVKDKKHPGYAAKMEWMRDQFSNGLVIFQARKAGKVIGFIEAVPIAHAWRPVQGENLMFIHCLWVYQKAEQHQGLGARLVGEIEKAAVAEGMDGVAATVSDGSWLANKNLFLKNGYNIIDTEGRFELVFKTLGDAVQKPQLIDFSTNAGPKAGWVFEYANQCPYHIKTLEAIKKVATEFNMDITLRELTSPAEAQQSAGGYGTIGLYNNERILADHYISETRMRNIVRKENK